MQTNVNRVTDICRKVPIKDAVDIMVKIDTLLKSNKIRVSQLFNRDDKFDLSIVKGLSRDVEDLLYYNFNEYSYGEFINWLRKNIDYFNKYMNKGEFNNSAVKSSCFDTKLPILNSSKMLFNLIKNTGAGNIKIVFTKIGELCDKSTYDKLLIDFELSNHEYASRVKNIKTIGNSFSLNITIDNVSIKMSIEGFNDLFIYQASVQNFNIYFDDVDTPWPNNYPGKVMKYHNDDYIWIYKSALKTNEEDVKFMLDSVMFACHFPVLIEKSGVIPVYSITSIKSNNIEKEISPLLQINLNKSLDDINVNSIPSPKWPPTLNVGNNSNVKVNAFKGILPTPRWPKVPSKNSNVKVNAFKGILPTPRWPKVPSKNSNVKVNAFKGILPTPRWPKVPSKNSNTNAFKDILPTPKWPKVISKNTNVNANALKDILPTPRWPKPKK